MQIEIDQADPQSLALKRSRQIRRDHRGAHPALRGQDGDHRPVGLRLQIDRLGAHRHLNFVFVRVEHELARAGPHRAQDEIRVLALTDDDHDAASGGDVVDEAKVVRSLRRHRDQHDAGIDPPKLVGHLLGSHRRAHDLGHALQGPAQVRLDLRVSSDD